MYRLTLFIIHLGRYTYKYNLWCFTGKYTNKSKVMNKCCLTDGLQKLQVCVILSLFDPTNE